MPIRPVAEVWYRLQRLGRRAYRPGWRAVRSRGMWLVVNRRSGESWGGSARPYTQQQAEALACELNEHEGS
ncbi:hypothetical protein [Streptomyces triculaminicus]|uniref:hypothetical protein n=1 Tax=Streptomyces triculaminicus TaxID=2816232 RepID=UPI0037AF3CDB